MKTAVRPRTALLLLLVLVIGIALGLLVARPLFRDKANEEAYIDPHEGQVQVYDHIGWTWITPLEGVDVNPFSREEFRLVDGSPVYYGSEYTALRGVDVSEHQYDIDWKQVADSGMDFAYIRIGRRGYTEGGLFNDPWFEKNYREAKENGLLVGVYFYSQAITRQEALEEAEFTINALQDRVPDLPIVYDWEYVSNEDAGIARTRDLDMDTRTDCAVAFCERIKEDGFDVSVYFNRQIGYHGYDLSRLTEYSFWFALPINPPDLCWPSFYYTLDMWQYTISGSVSGIDGPVDMDLIFIPVSQAEPSPSEPESADKP